MTSAASKTYEVSTQWVVITGAPSSGKTSVLNALEERGFRCEHEIARLFIEAQIAAGKDLETIRANKAELQDDILYEKLLRAEALPPDELIFLDRGIPDSISYYREAGVNIDQAIRTSYKFHYKEIFIFDRLPLVADGVRTEDEDVADFLDRQLEEDYRLVGYDPIRVPVVSIAERTEFILKKLRL